MNFFSGFRAKFEKIVTCVAFSIKFARTNQNLPKILNFVKIIHYYSKLFTGVLTHATAEPCLAHRCAPREIPGRTQDEEREFGPLDLPARRPRAHQVGRCREERRGVVVPKDTSE